MARTSWRELLQFALYVLYCVEGGILLLLVPWTLLWEEMIFLRYSRGLRDVLCHRAVRGAVSGVGLTLLLLGIGEIVRAFRGAPPRPGADEQP